MTAQQLAFWCRFGHPMDDDTTYLKRGERKCSECLRIHLAAVRDWQSSRLPEGGAIAP